MRIGKIPILRNLQRRFRKRRALLFQRLVDPTPDWKILDIGGTYPTWVLPGMEEFRVTLLNLQARDIPEDLRERLHPVAGDATALEYADQEFDLVYSNSVIEHVGDYESQRKFAAEARRVAPRLWIQTPAHEFFFEPHYLTPFIHWVSPPRRIRLVRWLTLWGLATRPSPEQARKAVEMTRLLSKSEMSELFPDCEILEEKFLGMTKSYIAVRG